MMGTARRSAAIIGALVGLAVAAAPRAYPASTHAPTAASNLAAAQHDVVTLLARYVAPPGGSAVPSEPAGDGGYLADPPAYEVTPNLVTMGEWYVVPGSADGVIAYAKAHPPAGSQYALSLGQAEGPNGPYGSVSVGFRWPEIPGVLGDRLLVVSAIDLPNGQVGVRVDAQDTWITPRPAGERIPSGVRSASIIATGNTGHATVPLRIRSAARIRRLVALINALPIEQPGVRHCSSNSGPTFDLRFMAAHSLRPLAQVTTEQACNAVEFRAGNAEEPQLDGAYQIVDGLNRLGVIPDCAVSQLHPDRVTFGPVYAGFNFTSNSHHLCRLAGYPRLTVLDRRGARLPLTIVDPRLAAADRTAVDMTFGASATFFADWRAPDLACPDPVVSAEVRLPGRGTGSLVLPVSRQADLPWQWPCRGKITLQPFVPEL